METFYKYKPPELRINENIKMVPNQYGTLLKYNDLYEDKKFSKNFRKFIKDYFHYDLSFCLKHEKLNYEVSKEITINEEIIKLLSNDFKDKDSTLLIKKSKDFMKFYPKNKENNYVLKFIECYKTLSGESYDEEEINTENIMMWDKPIKILLIELLKIIDKDKNIDATMERIEEDEDKIIENLNILYSIIYQFKINKTDKQVKSFSYVPNRKGVYKKTKDIYENSDIDEDILEILEILNEKISFEHILRHNGIILDKNHEKKTLKDIALVIDKEIKKRYDKIDEDDQKYEILDDDKFRKGCQLLFQKWFKDHKDKIILFEFASNHLIDISMKFLFSKETRNTLENILINDPQTLDKLIKCNNPNIYLFNDESFWEVDDSFFSMDSSFSATLDNSSMQPNNNNFFINNNNDNSRNMFINNYINIRNNNYYKKYVQMKNDKILKKYCLAQAYVYEKLINSKYLKEVQWKNKVGENEEEDEDEEENEIIQVTLNNNHRYKIKQSYEPYDFIVKTRNNKSYRIAVQNGDKSRKSYLKFSFSYPQWNLLYSEQDNFIVALVSLKNENIPDIYFEKNIKLNQL